MASVYGYCSVEDLENYAATDYSVVDSSYTDTVIEAIISQGEREINAKVGSSFTGTIPDGIKSIAIELSYRRMYNRMVWDGIMDRENPKKLLMPVWDKSLDNMIKTYISKNVSPIKLHRLWNNDPTVHI